MEKNGENKKNIQTWVQNQVRYDGMEQVGPEERHNDSEYSSNKKQIQVHKRSGFQTSILQLTIYHSQLEILQSSKTPVEKTKDAA